MADITKVTLAKEKDSGTEYYYPSSSSDIIDHQIKDTNVHVSVKKKLDDLEDLVGSINTDIDIQEVIDARTARSDNLVKGNLKIRIDKDYDALNNKINNIRKVAIVGGSESFHFPSRGLFKIADGTLDTDEYIVLTFAISSIKYNGILVLYAVNNNDEISANVQVTCGNFDNSGDNITFTVSTLENEWVLYYDTGLEYDSNYKVLFEVISEYGTNTKNANYTLHSNLEASEYLDDNASRAELMQFPYGRKKDSLAGNYSFAVGKDNTASGMYSNAIGENNTASGNYDYIVGMNNISNVFEPNNTAISGDGYHFVIGSQNEAYKKYSYAMGVKNIVDSDSISMAIGEENSNYQKHSFAIGVRNNIQYVTQYDNGYYAESEGRTIAIGYENIISTYKAIGIGSKNKITGDEGIIIGTENECEGYNDIVLGRNNTIYRISGDDDSTCAESCAIGMHNEITGLASMAIGISNRHDSDGAYVCNRLIGENTHVVGADNYILSNYSMIVGNLNRTADTAVNRVYIFGENNYIFNDRSTNIGIDQSIGSYALGYNNSIYNGSIIVGSRNVAKGEASICIGHSLSYDYNLIRYTGDADNNESEGCMSMVIGYASKANGLKSIAIGHNNKSNEIESLAIGHNTWASTKYSISIGNSVRCEKPQQPSTYDDGSKSISIGNSIYNCATAGICMGYKNNNNAIGAITMGIHNTNSSIGSFMCGIGGKSENPRSSTLDNTYGDVFVIGNGNFREEYISGGVANDQETQSNAFRINNSGGAYLNTGTYNSIGADYAEFIKEWYDGNPDNEDRVGYMVTIGEDGKLHKANEGDYIIGITSGNPSIVGNADEEYYWRYERDRFNRVIIEEAEIKIPKLDSDGNPITNMDDEPIMETIKVNQRKQSSDYDASKEYIERAKRPEWDYVGMRGIVPCRDDGTCVARGFCKCGSNGIATKAETRGFDTYYVIERIDEETISVEVR